MAIAAVISSVALAAALVLVLALAVRLRALRGALGAAADAQAAGADDAGLFRSLVQHSSDVILLLDEDGTIRYASAAATAILARDPEELVGARIADLVHPEDRLKVHGLLAEAVGATTEAPSADFRVHRGGGPHWAYVEAVATNRAAEPPVGALALALRDITRRKWAEEALRAAERRYRSLVEQIPLVTYLDNADAVSSAIFMSPQIEPLLGYTPEEWVADPDLFAKLLHPDDRERVLELVALSHETGSFNCEYRLIARDGRIVWFHDESTLIRDEAGTPLYAQGYMLDITAQRTNGDGAGRHVSEALLSRADAP